MQARYMGLVAASSTGGCSLRRAGLQPPARGVAASGARGCRLEECSHRVQLLLPKPHAVGELL